MADNTMGTSPAHSSGTPPAIELRGIDKRFGAVHANKSIDLVVERGHIHGIVGENGAGKSTLMSILYGFYEADAGEILVNGEAVRITESRDAIRHGIGMVHQHFMLVDVFTVIENVILGAEDGPLLRESVARARRSLKELAEKYHLEVDPDAVVGQLPVGAQQRVEILKALYRSAEILILDEPTGVLTPQEADHLFRVLARLRDEGKTIILITHKLREIMAITDRVSVMRQGQMVAHRVTKETSPAELGELMVGRKIVTQISRANKAPGETRLTVEKLQVRDPNGVERVKGVSFSVRGGEIVGIAGVSGNGQTELLEALSGIRRPSNGTIAVSGQTIFPAAQYAPHILAHHKVRHVPEDRQRMGLVTAFTATECMMLGDEDDPAYHQKNGILIDWQKVAKDAATKMSAFDVRPMAPGLKTANFSGGNQQKIILAREMERNPDVLLVGQPTRGVDIGAIEFIHRRLLAMRDLGKAILLVSVELDEIFALSDRILVMFDGHIVGEVPAAEANEKKLGLLMAGVTQDAAE
ncbi:MAG TPA: ABC transporter ATP-binding protein [Magnetospirillaceae bacterium]|jgi:simple sugar transport system ATP-binding protein